MIVLRNYISLFIIFLLLGCVRVPKKDHYVMNDLLISQGFKKIENKKDIYPLKKEWKDLYNYIEQGHLMYRIVETDRHQYSYSHEFSSFINRNNIKIYYTSFLQNYDNFIKTFGIPCDIEVRNRKIYISYIFWVLDDPAIRTAIPGGFSAVFDEQTKVLLKE